MRTNRITSSCFVVLMFAAVASPLLAKTVFHGSWTEVRSSTAGGWSIEQEGERLVLVLDDDFSTRKAPDLKLILSPRAADQLTSGNVLTGSLLLAKLESPKGEQRFLLPAGLDLARYRSLAIHCEKYEELWSVAPLVP